MRAKNALLILANEKFKMAIPMEDLRYWEASEDSKRYNQVQVTEILNAALPNQASNRDSNQRWL